MFPTFAIYHLRDRSHPFPLSYPVEVRSSNFSTYIVTLLTDNPSGCKGEILAINRSLIEFME